MNLTPSTSAPTAVAVVTVPAVAPPGTKTLEVPMETDVAPSAPLTLHYALSPLDRRALATLLSQILAWSADHDAGRRDRRMDARAAALKTGIRSVFPRVVRAWNLTESGVPVPVAGAARSLPMQVLCPLLDRIATAEGIEVNRHGH